MGVYLKNILQIIIIMPATEKLLGGSIVRFYKVLGKEKPSWYWRFLKVLEVGIEPTLPKELDFEFRVFWRHSISNR